MLADLLNPQVIVAVSKQPELFWYYVDQVSFLLTVKLIVLSILFLYLIFALTIFIQAKRLEKWLFLLHQHGFPKWALVHLALAGVGWLTALVIL